MSDPLDDVSPTGASPFVTSGDAVRQSLRLLRQARDRFGGDVGGPVPDYNVRPVTTVLVRNDTGADVPAFSVLALGTPVVSALSADSPYEVQRTPAFPGTAIAATTDPYCVTLEPVADDGFGLAAVLGVVVCDVLVSDAAHGYAVPRVGTTGYFDSGATGPGKVIWKESGTGTKRALVLLCGQGAGSAGTTITVVEADGSPSVSAGRGRRAG